ncbi:MAG TPA: orotate phosphoribosyltransferase [Smithellaceae bacterium]|jgi:orotate phosphoribosyltransferase|nr:MAG: Orotate phosphoribosyltransferase [Deltaproteobacteria bacterium ADurb.Bin002]HNV56767.1 orotate phosphoribosyltransferase [Smithellaceae bacterium]HOD64049.1 orotate phosphoribosyltransferase [Smithellaceae bacterium]HOR62647.1 orotate phosphoribosyltransferase [Smithellaceae bacterium]HOU57283.1 orotate phosphoribosyltransferase [Smithellaceae bacterium]
MMSMDQSTAKKRLGKIILERSFKYSDNPPFTLASGRQSNFYFNCKPTTLDPEGMNLIGEIVFDMLKDAPVTAAGGLTLGADPIANALAVISFQRGKPIKSFIVRKDVKAHGTKSAIEGNVAAGERVAIIDDVITTGGSTITAIEQARRAGLVVDRVITLIDREEGGRENILQRADCVESVFTRTQIMALREEILSGQQRT